MTDLHIIKLRSKIAKINFLLKDLQKSDTTASKLEVNLLKKYAMELYDTALDIEMEQVATPSVATEETVTTLEEKNPEQKEEKVSLQPSASEITSNDTMIQIPLKPEQTEEEIPEFLAKPEPEPEIESTLSEEATKPKVERQHPLFGWLKTDKQLESTKEEQMEESKVKTQVLHRSDLLETKLPEPPSKPAPKPPKEVPAPKKEEEATDNLALHDILSQQKNKPTLADKLNPSAHTRTIRVNLNERFAFVSNLFNGDANALNNALDGLAHCNDYIEALGYINLNLRKKYGWQDDDPVVQSFKNLLREKFASF